MMDWGLIFSALIGFVTGSGGSWLFRIRADKMSSKTDAMTKMMVLITDQQDRFNKIISDKDDMIQQQRGLINEYKTALDDANQKIKHFEYKVTENERKIQGMQKAISAEIKERKYAEENICLVEDCELRRPAKGTFKNNSDENK